MLGLNELTGAIPAELCGLSALTDLDLGSNQLWGSIPSELGNLDDLYGLQLSNNNLNGPIPAALADISPCHVLHLDNNPSLVCWETVAARDWALGLPDYQGPVVVCP